MTVERFALQMTAAECLPYYRGQISWIQVKAQSGRTIRFPARLIRQFIESGGISGLFEIEFDSAGKLKRLDKIS